MPITGQEVKDITYTESQSPVKPSSKEPVFNYAVGFSKQVFTKQSYIAVEVWNKDATNSAETFIGGAMLTIAQIEYLKPVTEVYIMRIANGHGVSTGVLKFAWRNDDWCFQS